MDPLSDLLRVVRLDGAYFYGVRAAGSWSIESAAAHDLAPRILPAADHLISYHFLTAGRCFSGLSAHDQVELVAGDVIIFPHGDSYVMSSGPGTHTGPAVNRSTPARFPNTVVLGDAAGTATAQFVCGFLGCDRLPFNPLLSALPRLLHVRGVQSDWLGAFAHRVTEATRQGGAGSDGVVTRLAELMFIEAVRQYLDSLPPTQPGWLSGLRDEVVGRVLALIHARPGHPWTLEALAHEAASSRSRLATRFSSIVGQPPMQYLAHWRIQIAAHLLVEGGAKIAAIAEQVGYDSESAFSRAFKKATGVAPGAWRTRRHAR